MLSQFVAFIQSCFLYQSAFLLAKFRQKANSFYLWPIFGEIWTQKIYSCRQKFIHFTFFIHLNPSSSTFRVFIQHPDELASGYVLVVPPGRKTKNHRKNTGTNMLSLRFHHGLHHTVNIKNMVFNQ
jgi:hypothetical protein